MKKTMLLTSLIAVAAIAKTTGNVEFFNENEAKFGATKEFKVNKVGVKTEVKVDKTGLSFGGTFQAKDLKLGKVTKANYLNNSNVFMKYELPEIKGVNSYVKATVSPKFAGVYEKDKMFDKGNAELEGDLSYKYNDLTFGLNTKTNLPLSNKKVNEKNESGKTTYELKDVDYATLVSSTHKAYVKGNYAPLKDIKGEVEVNHTYKESKKDAKDAFKYVSLLADASYDVMKDLTLNGKFRFKYQFNGDINYKDQYLGDKDLLEFAGGGDVFKEKVDYIHAYSLEGVYKGVKDTELKANVFVNHANKTATNESLHLVDYGVMLNAKYTGVQNLTLTGKTTLSGLSTIEKLASNKVSKEHTALFGVGLGAKYDYKVTDKFTVSPEFNADLKVVTAPYVPHTSLGLQLTPKVSAEYKPAESLTVKGEVSVPVNFKGTIAETIINDKKETKASFGYTDTQLKTALNIKYEWK